MATLDARDFEVTTDGSVAAILEVSLFLALMIICLG